MIKRLKDLYLSLRFIFFENQKIVHLQNNISINNLKAIFSYSLLFIFFLKMGGFLAIMSVEREIIKENVEEKLAKSFKKSDLTCIVANPENLTKISWESFDKEFRFEGKLYDIVFTEIKGNQTYYYCLSDEEETRLETKINLFLDKKPEQLPFGNNAKSFLQFLLEPLTIHTNSLLDFKYFTELQSFKFPQISFPKISDLISKLKRPPQYLLDNISF
jgi:hypothetical protein